MSFFYHFFFFILDKSINENFIQLSVDVWRMIFIHFKAINLKKRFSLFADLYNFTAHPLIKDRVQIF
jgi:hypothetical protein